MTMQGQTFRGGSVQRHYEVLLGPIYAWSVGGIDAATQRAEDELKTFILNDRDPKGIAVDLGAGFGAHSIPLARSGWRVLAIDFCGSLLDQLRRSSGSLPIQCIEDDLLNFGVHLCEPADLILCLGDTLTHLPDRTAVASLIARMADALVPDGRCVLGFRDYSAQRSNTDRFIPVRFDDDRLLTCVLEYRRDRVVVHDLLHRRTEKGWVQMVNSYEKLRLSPDWVMDVMHRRGFQVATATGPAGMIFLAGQRRSEKSG